MEYRVFRNPDQRSVNDDRAKSFGRRTGFAAGMADRVTAGRVVKALLLGLGLGALASVAAGTLL